MIIEARFNGPPGSGNGGYTAGLVASALGADRTGAEVTLRMPPPLETPLRLTPRGEVYAGERLVAEVATATVAGEPVPFSSPEDAGPYPGLTDHPFPTCYVCGPERRDGLRIFPGTLPDGRTAAAWLVPADVSAVTVWAALDCPGGWAIIGPGRPYLLGRIAASVAAVPEPRTRCVVLGEVMTSEGRKAGVRSALYTVDGTLLAQAHATWIEIRGSNIET